MEKPSRRPLTKAETFGRSTPMISAASACVRFRSSITLLISIARSALARSWSACGKPRSAKTFPLDLVTLISSLMLPAELGSPQRDTYRALHGPGKCAQIRESGCDPMKGLGQEAERWGVSRIILSGLDRTER